MKVPYLALAEHFNHPQLLAELHAHFINTDFILGNAVTAFETEFAAMCGSAYAIGVNSGADALFLALKALDIQAGDEVITAPNSFIASAAAIVAAGARPVFADVGADYNLDPRCVAAVITPRTRAIMPVHLTGNPVDMTALTTLAKQHKLVIVEDAAQAVHAVFQGTKTGAWGECGCFSLHPLKNLPVAGDGGIITTQSPELAEKLRRLRNHGLKNRDQIDYFGYNSRLDTLQASIARFGLQQLASITQARQRNAARYDALLADLPQVTIPPRRADVSQVFHTYVIQVQRRTDLIAFLAAHGIDSKIHYPIPIHLQAPCRKMGYAPGDFPVCEAQVERILSLPIQQHLQLEQIDYVAAQIRRFYTTV